VSSALPFVPMSVESFGRLGAPALTLLRDLANQAVQAGGPGFSWAAFISGALRELSVALCRGNASLCRSRAYVVTLAAGRTPMRGLARPLAEVVEACLTPRVWVWGVWFGFALRCVALLCGVFVRLHQALFPAGGPFLPSICIIRACVPLPSARSGFDSQASSPLQPAWTPAYHLSPPLQLGVGVPYVSPCVCSTRRSGLYCCPRDGGVILQLDFQNAFNNVSRHVILQAGQAAAPTSPFFAAWLYQAHGLLIVRCLPIGSSPVTADLPSDPTVAQLSLPLCSEGFGLRLPTPLNADATFLSASSTAEIALRSAPAPFRPFQPTNLL
jgi:hypothetical protein